MGARTGGYAQFLVLLAGAIWSLTTGASYLPGVTVAELPGGILLFLQGSPFSLNTYAAAWLITGAIILASMIWRRMALLGILLFIGMCILTSTVYAGSWLDALIHHQPSREWVAAGKYLAGCIVGLALTPRRKKLAVPHVKIRKAGG